MRTNFWTINVFVPCKCAIQDCCILCGVSRLFPQKKFWNLRFLPVLEVPTVKAWYGHSPQWQVNNRAIEQNDIKWLIAKLHTRSRRKVSYCPHTTGWWSSITCHSSLCRSPTACWKKREVDNIDLSSSQVKKSTCGWLSFQTLYSSSNLSRESTLISAVAIFPPADWTTKTNSPL